MRLNCPNEVVGVGPTGSNYWGNYQFDRKYVSGQEIWKDKNQKYEGDFFGDCIHGEGLYQWNLSNEKNFYDGYFYANIKDGYALLSMPNNSCFEGLFFKNQPFGPGVLTYSNGRQDVGFWLGTKLVRLSRPVDFIVPRLAATESGRKKLLSYRHKDMDKKKWTDSLIEILKRCGCPLNESCPPYSSLVYDTRSVFFDKPIFEKTYFTNSKNSELSYLERDVKLEKEFMEEEWEQEEDEVVIMKPVKRIPPHCVCSKEEFVMKYKSKNELDEISICADKDKNSSGSEEMGFLGYFSKYGTLFAVGSEDEKTENPSFEENVHLQNLNSGSSKEEENTKFSPIQFLTRDKPDFFMEMLEHTFRNQGLEDKVYFKIAKLMLGVRTAFRKTGEKEKQCLHFLKMCSTGPPYVVKDLLCNYDISEELTDSRGNNSLMFAAATDQHEVMDILLDYGVDINTLNDENLSPLNLALLRRLAQANGITNWESAFLPKLVDDVDLAETLETGPTDVNTRWKRYGEFGGSIKSLDRTFGDGMSIQDEKDTRVSASVKDFLHTDMYRVSSGGQLNADISEITIINVKNQSSNIIYGPAKHSDEMNCEESENDTLRLKTNIVPQSHRRIEFELSVKKADDEKYLFSLASGKELHSQKPTEETKTGREYGNDEFEEKVDVEIPKKLTIIDKTIEKLLNRGADPNATDVPKSSLHLGIFTRDKDIVKMLLSHGANPNQKLRSEEGLLTPLQVLVLQEPHLISPDICELLLKYGADPNQLTMPDFSMEDEDKDLLDSNTGRTALELLSMREDLEDIDQENIISVALMLAKLADKDRLYKGNNCITLAMQSGNMKLMKALLESNYFDPNQELGDGLGTPLQVLLSTKMQKKLSLEKSIKMCDLLLSAGADPLKKLNPPNLEGTIFDFGQREIEAEIIRKSYSSTKKGKAKENKGGKTEYDSIKSQMKLLEYLNNIPSTNLNESSPEESESDVTERSGTYRNVTEQAKARNDKNIIPKIQYNIPPKTQFNVAPKSLIHKQKIPLKKITPSKEHVHIKTSSESFAIEEGKNLQQIHRTNAVGVSYEAQTVAKTTAQTKAQTRAQTTAQTTAQTKARTHSPKKTKGKPESHHSEETSTIYEDQDVSQKEGTNEDSKQRQDDEKSSDSDIESSERTAEKDHMSESQKLENKDHKEQTHGHHALVKRKKFKKTHLEMKDEEKGRGGKKVELSDTAVITKPKDKDLIMVKRKTPLKGDKSWHPKRGKVATVSEALPEVLRQRLHQMFGNWVNVDINEFLLPYVVLRDGDLYYRFHGKKPARKEQYSLI